MPAAFRLSLAFGLLAVLPCATLFGQPAERTEPVFGLELTGANPGREATLEALDAAVAGRDWDRTATLLLQLFAAEDAFVPLIERSRGGTEVQRHVGLHGEARRRLGELPPEGRNVYRQRAEAEAGRLLDVANRTTNLVLLATVVVRFPDTAASADALQELALDDVRAGRDRLAALRFQRLREVRGVDRWEPEVLLQAAVVHHRIGDSDRTAYFEARLRERKNLDAMRQLEQRKAENDKLARELRQRGDWRFPGGTADRAAEAHGTPPVAEARWGFKTTRTNEMENWLAQAANALQKRGQPLVPASQPIFVTVTHSRTGEKRQTILFRSHWGIHAVDPSNGKLRWESYSNWSADRMVKEATKQAAITDWVKGWLNRRPEALFENSVVGGLSTDGRMVFAVEDFGVGPYAAPREPKAPGGLSAIAEARRHNKIQAYDLWAGKLFWECPDPLRKTGVELLDGDGHFLGAPLPLDGRLYVLAEKNQELRLVQLDPATGHVLSQHPLGKVRCKLTEDNARRRQAAHLAYADGVLVCPTNCGALVAVDPASGALLWAHTYATETPLPPDFMPSVRNWPVTTAPVLRDGKVFYAPVDGSELLCFRLDDGSPVWKVDRRDDDVYFAGVFDGKALIVGKKSVRALDATGKEVWKLETGEPSGLGVAADGLYLLPLRLGAATGGPEVVVLDVKRGVVHSHVRWPKSEVPGNLALFGSDVVSQSATELVVYPQAKGKK
jgi:outer membrane protein assembly factor BamB